MSNTSPAWPNTHGRWPWIAAAATVPATIAAWHGRQHLRIDGHWVSWLAGPALLYHQTEEWVMPGGFLPWFNQTVMKGTNEFPITRRTGFIINVVFGWGLAVACAITGRRLPAITALNVGLMAGNSAVHIGAALTQRRYNPGLATATVLFIPFTALGSRALLKGPAANRRSIAGGFTAGLAVSAMTFFAMKQRTKPRKATSNNPEATSH